MIMHTLPTLAITPAKLATLKSSERVFHVRYAVLPESAFGPAGSLLHVHGEITPKIARRLRWKATSYTCNPYASEFPELREESHETFGEACARIVGGASVISEQPTEWVRTWRGYQMGWGVAVATEGNLYIIEEVTE